ncbi:putative metal-dependent enzyme of the double-stranded beta helix superfamily protein [Variovorax sp. PBL-H6]|uniref:cysteine dioxygenase family protein n=1 Tax=Variovorax sp. PBL-H6 TaxID=434009 RepID=UPI00131965FF|nr:cysteine dioxygenase [Variovorax sp. PBL-H6]VTU33455.1 putative metal-dependent enzyme of the double-stranded beta helix superfamily protein [Variovorax sp. PBL-H6]
MQRTLANTEATPCTSDGKIAKLRSFIEGMEAVLQTSRDAIETMNGVSTLLSKLIANDDWLPAPFAMPHPEFYQQYLLHADPAGRFSVVSFVWGPGQKTPVHDHCVWGVIGMLRGGEVSQGFRIIDGSLRPNASLERLAQGDTARVSPETGDIHQVANAFADRVSISIHVYGTDIGQQRRHLFDPATGAAKDFISGYSNMPRSDG